MQVERLGADSIIIEGKMWVLGGNGEDHHRLASTELIDSHESKMISSSGEFSRSHSLESPPIFYIDLPEALARHSIVRLNNTMSFLIAGQPEDPLQSNRTYYFHHETYTWTNGPNLTTARILHAAGVIKDRGTLTEHVVVTGGATYGDSGSETIDSVEIMFSNENKWTSGTSCLRVGKSLN